ncbi:MAG: SDR family oxidoreductase [Clostridia bacterium]|nr:SDR family oxidoreductase [Clostridia bacterium]
MEFKDKTVIITGASVGIGKATAIEFASRGATLGLIGINAEQLEEVKSEIEALGAEVSAYVCDVSNEESVKKTVSGFIAKYGKIDVLVNNAGVWRYTEAFVEMDSSIWKKIIDINILGTMYFSQAVLKNMIENKYGRIINLGSVAGVYGNAYMAPYSMSKGAISAFTKALAKEVTGYGITVNNVVPGNVLNEGATSNEALSFANRSGRLEEFAYLICFLASDKAAFISGQDYQIDGCRKKM